MELLDTLLAKRLAGKLRSARCLSAGALERIENELVELGPPAIDCVKQCLSHGDARTPAMRVLDRLLSKDTLEGYLQALSSPNPAVASGVGKVLSRNRNYDAFRLVGLLAGSSTPKPTLEAILREQADRIPPAHILQVFPQLGKDGQAVAFRFL